MNCNVISEAQRCFTARNRCRYSSILEALFMTQGIKHIKICGSMMLALELLEFDWLAPIKEHNHSIVVPVDFH